MTDLSALKARTKASGGMHSLSGRCEATDPSRLLDALIEMFDLKNDAALSRFLVVAPPIISKIRHRKLSIGASFLVRIHDVTNLSINDVRGLMGAPKYVPPASSLNASSLGDR